MLVIKGAYDLVVKGHLVCIAMDRRSDGSKVALLSHVTKSKEVVVHLCRGCRKQGFQTCVHPQNFQSCSFDPYATQGN